MSKAHKREKVSKPQYRQRRQDKEELSDTMGNIEAWAERIAGISSLYNQRCLISNPDDEGDMDAQLKNITASAIADLRSAFNKLAEGEEMLNSWLVAHKTSFLGKLLPFS
jgi:hypothetical protein|tara:strand:- start:483 stop:812 length:330 start_codon:yes stop_codon:yes gene_type:complete